MNSRSVRPLRPLSISLARFSSTFALAAAMALAGSARTPAAVLDWDPAMNLSNSGGTGPWNLTNTFWNNGLADQLWNNATNDIAQFSLSGGTVTLGAGITAGGLNFNVDAMTITGNTLTLGGGTPTFNVLGGLTATISSALAGTAGAVLAGGGTLVLTQNNAGLSGAWDLQAGLLRATNYGALGGGAVTVESGATLQFSAGGNGSVFNAITLNGGIFRHTTQSDLRTEAPINVLAGGGTLEMTAGANYGKIFVAAGITGTGNLAVNGTHAIVQIVQSNFGYSGNWTLNGGYTEVQALNALGTGTVMVNTGAELVASNNVIPNSVIIASAGAVLGFNNGNNGVFKGPIAAAADFFVANRFFYDNNQSANGRISGDITGTGAMTILNPNVPAKLTLTGVNTAWSGAITVPTNVQLRSTVAALGSGALTVSGSLVLTTTPVLSVGANAGFNASYHSSALIGTGVVGGFDYSLVAPAAMRSEDTVDLANGNGTIPNPAIPGFNRDHNAELWTGILNVTTGGAYTFYTSSDDGSLLYVDGAQVVQNDFPQGVFERNGNFTLSPGLHSVIVKYGQGTGGGGMHAHYLGADTGGAQVLIGSIPGTVTNTGTHILGTSTLGTVDLGANGTGGFDLAAVNTTVTGPMVLQNSFNLVITGVTGYETLTQQGAVTLNGTHLFNIGVDQVLNGTQNASTGADMVISGNIGEASTSSIIKTGPRTLTLSGTNSFTGGVTINNGVLQLGSPAANAGAGPGGLIINPTAGSVVVRLLANEQLPNAVALPISSIGENTALLDLNGFAETIGALTVTGTATSITGVRTGAGGTLTVGGDIVLNNNRPATTNTGREAMITGTGTYTVAASNGTLNLGGVLRNITVETANTGANIPGSDATIETAITNGGINKLGSRTLILNGASTYALGTVSNAGAVRGVGASGATSSVFGTGLLTLKGGALELRNNGTGSNGAVNYGNDLLIDATQASGLIDVNNNGANTGNILSLGNLAIGTQTLNVTGGNSYGMRFASVTLSGNATVNLTSTGASLILNNVGEIGGARSLTKSATSPGVLILSGAGTYTGGTVVPAGSGPLRLVPTIGTTNKPAGTGAISLASGTTLQIAPAISTLTGVGATPGTLSAKFYNGATTISGANYGAIPTAAGSVALLADGTFFNRPAVLTPASSLNLLAIYSGLLNVTGGGTYFFQTATQDESQLVIDGVPVISVNVAGGSQPLTDSATSAPVTLGTGFHTISMKVFNGTANGGFRVRYQGTDTGGALQVISPTRLFNAPALLNVGNTGAPVTVAAAGTITLDGVGSDLDSSITTLALGAGSTLNAANVGGSGALTVAGTTTLGGAATLNPTTALLTLAGDLADGGSNFAVAKTGAGTLVLAGAKTFGGTLTISAGGVQVTNAASLGSVVGGTIVTAGAVLDLNGTALGAEPLTLNGVGTTTAAAALYNSSATPASASGTVNIATAGTKIGGYGDLTLGGVVSGASTFSKTGPATLNLNGVNTFSAAFTVSQGVVKLGDNSALGTTAAGTTVSSGGTLDLNGRTIAEPLTLTGSGLANIGAANTLGALVNNSASPAVASGTVVLSSTVGIGSTSLTVGGGGLTLSGIISGSGTLNKVGGNTLTLTAINSYTGAVNVNLGTLVLSGAGRLAGGANPFTVNPTATLTLDDAGTNNVSSRLGIKNVTFIGANFNILGNAIANTLEDLGTGFIQIDGQNTVLTLTAGAGKNVRFNATGTGATADISGLQRLGNTVNGTALFRGTALGTTTFASLTANTANLTFGGTIPTVGQAGAENAKNRAIIPWALVATTTTGAGSSFATYSAANGVQVLQANNFDTTLVANSNIVAGAALTAAPGITTVNSLTLTGGGLTIGAGNSLALDSGGLLATATVGISGAGSLTTTASKEIIIHTAGAGTILTIGTPIATLGGLTKAGDGQLRLTAQNTFTGQLRLNGGTTVLAGGANTIFNVRSTPPPASLATQASTSTSSNFLIVDAGATLDLNGNDQRVGGLASFAAAGSNFPGTSGIITNTSGTFANFRFSRASQGTGIIPTVLAGNLNIQRDGLGTVTLTSPNTYLGTTTITGGTLALQDGGTLAGTTALAIRRAVLSIDDTGLQSLVRVNAAATVALDGGAIAFLSRSGGTQDTLALGALSLNTGASLIRQSLGGGGSSATGTSTVTFTSLARSQGATINFTAVLNGNVQLGDNPRVLLPAAPALTGGLVGGWATTQGYNSSNSASGSSNFDFAAYDPVTGFRPASYSAAFASGANVNLEPVNAGGVSLTTLAAGDTAINSLRLGGLGTTTGTTLAFSAATDVLNLQTGGLLSTASNSPRTLGLAADEGRLTAGGGALSGTSELFIHNGANTLTVNARIINNPNGAQVALVLDALSQNSTILLAGSNTYTGTTYVNGVGVSLGSAALAIPGNLVISGGTANGGDSQAPASQTVKLLASNQLAPAASVTVNGGGALNLNGFSNTIGSLILAADGGGALGIGPVVQTGTGVLTLTGGITATNLIQATTIPAISGNVVLPAGIHTVAIGTFLGTSGQVGLQINAAMTGPGSLSVTSGVLGLGDTVSTTRLNLTAASSLTLTNLANATTIHPTIGTLTGAGSVNVALSGTAAVELVVGNDNGSGIFSGTFTGPIALSKVGTGNQTINQSATFTALSVAAGGTFTFGDGSSLAGFAPEANLGPAVVPEPGALGLLALGALSLLARRRRG